MLAPPEAIKRSTTPSVRYALSLLHLLHQPQDAADNRE
jgi:hypothetical protein